MYQPVDDSGMGSTAVQDAQSAWNEVGMAMYKEVRVRATQGAALRMIHARQMRIRRTWAASHDLGSSGAVALVWLVPWFSPRASRSPQRGDDYRPEGGVGWP